jgi:hypothetical protein
LLSVSVAPIRKYIEYEPKIFHMTETSKDYPLVGQPSDELDARWSNLMQYFYAQVPASYMKKLGREKTGIRLDNGNYLANFAWVHQVSTVSLSLTPHKIGPRLTSRLRSFTALYVVFSV